jgi:flagellar basal body-associated protein FliL
MKTKDIIYVVVSVVIFAVSGYLVFTMLIPQSTAAKSTLQQTEVVGALSPDLDYTTVNKMLDKTKNVDFSVVIDLNSNTGNPSVFGQ